MKHKQQMSLIARRAQIRRAVAHRKDSSSAQPAGRPALRLVISGGDDLDRDQRADHREPTLHVE